MSTHDLAQLEEALSSSEPAAREVAREKVRALIEDENDPEEKSALMSILSEHTPPLRPVPGESEWRERWVRVARLTDPAIIDCLSRFRQPDDGSGLLLRVLDDIDTLLHRVAEDFFASSLGVTDPAAMRNLVSLQEELSQAPELVKQRLSDLMMRISGRVFREKYAAVLPEFEDACLRWDMARARALMSEFEKAPPSCGVEVGRFRSLYDAAQGAQAALETLLEVQDADGSVVGWSELPELRDRIAALFPYVSGSRKVPEHYLERAIGEHDNSVKIVRQFLRRAVGGTGNYEGYLSLAANIKQCFGDNLAQLKLYEPELGEVARGVQAAARKRLLGSGDIDEFVAIITNLEDDELAMPDPLSQALSDVLLEAERCRNVWTNLRGGVTVSMDAIDGFCPAGLEAERSIYGVYAQRVEVLREIVGSPENLRRFVEPVSATPVAALLEAMEAVRETLKAQPEHDASLQALEFAQLRILELRLLIAVERRDLDMLRELATELPGHGRLTDLPSDIETFAELIVLSKEAHPASSRDVVTWLERWHGKLKELPASLYRVFGPQIHEWRSSRAAAEASVIQDIIGLAVDSPLWKEHAEYIERWCDFSDDARSVRKLVLNRAHAIDALEYVRKGAFDSAEASLSHLPESDPQRRTIEAQIDAERALRRGDAETLSNAIHKHDRILAQDPERFWRCFTALSEKVWEEGDLTPLSRVRPAVLSFRRVAQLDAARERELDRGLHWLDLASQAAIESRHQLARSVLELIGDPKELKADSDDARRLRYIVGRWTEAGERILLAWIDRITLPDSQIFGSDAHPFDEFLNATSAAGPEIRDRIVARGELDVASLSEAEGELRTVIRGWHEFQELVGLAKQSVSQGLPDELEHAEKSLTKIGRISQNLENIHSQDLREWGNRMENWRDVLVKLRASYPVQNLIERIEHLLPLTKLNGHMAAIRRCALDCNDETLLDDMGALVRLRKEVSEVTVKLKLASAEGSATYRGVETDIATILMGSGLFSGSERIGLSELDNELHALHEEELAFRRACEAMDRARPHVPTNEQLSLDECREFLDAIPKTPPRARRNELRFRRHLTYQADRTVLREFRDHVPAWVFRSLEKGE